MCSERAFIGSVMAAIRRSDWDTALAMIEGRWASFQRITDRNSCADILLPFEVADEFRLVASDRFEQLWLGCYGVLDEADLQHLIGDGIWLRGDRTATLQLAERVVERLCRNCDLPFEMPRVLHRPIVYCSEECRLEARRRGWRRYRSKRTRAASDAPH